MLAAACSGDGGADDSPDATAGATAGTTEGGDALTRPSDTDPGVLECERLGYPCQLEDVPVEVEAATDGVIRLAATFLGAGVDSVVIADGLRDLPGVAEVLHDPIGLMVRLEGGVPAWTAVDELDGHPIDSGVSGTTPQAPRGPAAQPPAARTVGPGSGVLAQAGGGGGVVGTVGEGKEGLVVSPYGFSGSAQLAEALAHVRDYRERGGRVEARIGSGSEPGVGDIDRFRGWDAFDTIVVATHGAGVCSTDDDGELIVGADGSPASCHTVLSAGGAKGDLAAVRAAHGDVPGVVVFERTRRMRTDLSTSELIDLLIDVCLPEMEADLTGGGGDACYEPMEHDDEGREIAIGLSTDFFRHTYPDGLADRLIMLSACSSMRIPDLADHLVAGGDGVALGYGNIVWSDQSATVRASLGEHVADGLPIEDLMAANHAAFGEGRGPRGPQGAPVLVHSGDDLVRGRDVVALVDPHTGEEIADGAELALTTSDEGRIAFDAIVRVTGVGDQEDAATFAPDVIVNGAVTQDQVSLVHDRGDGAWESDVVAVPLLDGLEVDDPFDAEVRLALPRGGESRWRYEDLRVGLDLRVDSRIVYDAVPGFRLESVVTGTGRLRAEGEHGWQATIDLDWERIDLDTSGFPVACTVDGTSMVSTLEVLGGGATDDGAVLDWRIAEREDRVDISCGGHSLSQAGFLQGVLPSNLGVGLGYGAMYIAMGDNAVLSPDFDDAVRTEDFRPSTAAGVVLEHTVTNEFEGITATLRLELVAPGTGG